MINLKNIGLGAGFLAAFALGNALPYKPLEATYEFFATPHYVAGPHQAHRSNLEFEQNRVYRLDNKDCMYDNGSFIETKGFDIDGRKLKTGNLCFSIPQSMLEKQCQAIAKTPVTKEKAPAAEPAAD